MERNKVFVSFLEEKENYTNQVYSSTMDKEDIPATGDVVEIWPDIVDKTVIKRKLKYFEGTLTEVKIYIKTE